MNAKEYVAYHTAAKEAAKAIPDPRTMEASIDNLKVRVTEEGLLGIGSPHEWVNKFTLSEQGMQELADFIKDKWGIVAK